MSALTLTPVIPFTSSEKTEAVIIVITGVISAGSVIITLLRAAIVALRPGRKDSKEAVFFRTQLGYYAAALLLANLVGAISSVLEVFWVIRDGVMENTICTTQATMIQIANFAGAYLTTVTAIHTFNALVLKNHPQIWMSIIIIAVGFGLSAAVGLALPLVQSHIHGDFYGDIGLFCTITSGYTVAQFSSTFLPIIVAAFTSSLLYAITYLCIRGNLEVNQGMRFNLSEENAFRRLLNREEYRSFVSAVIKSMLWYPFSYTVLLLPLTIVGLMKISGLNFSESLLTLGVSLASLQGVANVLILNNTLRVLKPAFTTPSVSIASESFFVPEERKISPVEAPRGPNVLGARSFPASPSGSSSPMARANTITPYRIYAKPAGEFSPYSSSDNLSQPPATAPLLRHYRSDTTNLSISSTTQLLNPEGGSHSRTTSNGGSVSTTSLQEPIIQPDELDSRLKRQPTFSTLPTSPRSAGLPPAPRRPTRSTVLRESLLNTFAAMPTKSPKGTPQYADFNVMTPPLPMQLPSQKERPMSSENDARSIYNFYGSMHMDDSDHGHDHDHDHDDDFEIHTAQARTILRPSISAVASTALLSPSLASAEAEASQVRRKGYRRTSEDLSVINEGSRSSATQTPTPTGDLMEIANERAATPERAGIAPLAWASLVANAARTPNTERPSPIDMPVEEKDWNMESPATPSLLSAKNTRMSGIPLSLRPGTPRTAPPQSLSFALPSPSSMPQGNPTEIVLRPVQNQDSWEGMNRRMVRPMRSFTADHRTNVQTGPLHLVQRSNTASPAFMTGYP